MTVPGVGAYGSGVYGDYEYGSPEPLGRPIVLTASAPQIVVGLDTRQFVVRSEVLDHATIKADVLPQVEVLAEQVELI